MSRKDVLRSPSYWATSIQMDLYRYAEQYMRQNNLNRSQLAEHLNVSKGYVSQLLNGEYDHRLSKVVELALAFGYVPQFSFVPIEEYERREQFRIAAMNREPVFKPSSLKFTKKADVKFNGYTSESSIFNNVA